MLNKFLRAGVSTLSALTATLCHSQEYKVQEVPSTVTSNGEHSGMFYCASRSCLGGHELQSVFDCWILDARDGVLLLEGALHVQAH